MQRSLGVPRIPPWFMLSWLLPLLSIQLALASSSPSTIATKGVYDWGKVSISSNKINWTPCFEQFLCTRLVVPLDWADESVGTTKVAFIKYPSQNESAEDLLLNFGGPGGSGVGSLIPLAPYLAEIFGSGVNLVSFDPRGVNNTGPLLDCFPGAQATRNNFDSIYYRTISDSSSDSINAQFYLAEAFGKWCNGVLGGPNGTAKYVNTPAIAGDMLRFVELQSATNGKPKEEAKLWFAGYSYGTVLGTTFASLYPNRIGRLILDGVEDSADYYNGFWSNNLVDADAVVDSFVTSCHDAGPDACIFYDNSTDLIYFRLSSVLTKLREEPVPVWNSSVVGMPALATYADFTNVLLLGLNFPLGSFPKIAQILVDLEQGHGESLIEARKLVFGCDCHGEADYGLLEATTMIQCVDSGGRNRVNSLEEYREYVNYLLRQSKYVGDAWPVNAMSCKSMDVAPPQSGQFIGSTSANKTSFPLLFIGNRADPVTPLRNAHKESSHFPESVVLTNDAAGHTSLSAISNCTIKYVQEYLAGSVPPANITCQPNELPFRSSLEGLAVLSEI